MRERERAGLFFLRLLAAVAHVRRRRRRGPKAQGGRASLLSPNATRALWDTERRGLMTRARTHDMFSIAEGLCFGSRSKRERGGGTADESSPVFGPPARLRCGSPKVKRGAESMSVVSLSRGVGWSIVALCAVEGERGEKRGRDKKGGKVGPLSISPSPSLCFALHRAAHWTSRSNAPLHPYATTDPQTQRVTPLIP